MRPDDDHYPTPPEVTRALMSVERFVGNIWEPCAGDGAMAVVLSEKYLVVPATIGPSKTSPRNKYNRQIHVQGNQDFLTYGVKQAANIITNPPFNIAEKIIRHALSLEPNRVAMLLNIRFLGSRKRKEGLFKEHPPKRIWVFCDRPSMYPADWTGPRTTTTETFSWWIWEWPFGVQKPELGWLDSKEFMKETP